MGSGAVSQRGAVSLSRSPLRLWAQSCSGAPGATVDGKYATESSQLQVRELGYWSPPPWPSLVGRRLWEHASPASPAARRPGRHWRQRKASGKGPGPCSGSCRVSVPRKVREGVG